MGHFVLSPREREKRDRRNSRGDEKKDGEKQVIENYKNSKPCSTVGQYQLNARDVRYTTPSPQISTI